jgi:enoyl-CoA hydratase
MTDQIISRVVGNLGHITLNRPKALNALTHEMCEEMTRLLVAWEKDPAIGAVLVDGSGDRSFCAGGDVILLHDSGKAGDKRAENFWRTEYALNDLIHRYKKPYIALIDGIVMGGGVGLSVHGRHRIAGDTTFFAMPETGIGYFPDVGGTFFLPRLGLAIGQWLGLTGARLKTAQVCALGIANSFVPTEQHPALIEALGEAELDGTDIAVLNVMSAFVQKPPTAEPIPDIVNAFGATSVTGILASLDADGGEWAQTQAENLRKKSPVALSVTFESLKRGAEMNFRDAMSQELNISLGFLNTQDFYEGIRAQLIDKDRNPKWSADSLTGVTAMEISRHFVATPTALKFLD